MFNAGKTPKEWNEKMLHDPHLKVVRYWAKSEDVFPMVDIKGGVAITYWDANADFGEIGTFTPFNELNGIMQKVYSSDGFKSFSAIVFTRTAYRLTDKMHSDYPQAISRLSEGHAYDMSTNIFEQLPFIFFDKKPDDSNEYIQMLGREGGKRVYRYVRRDYVNDVENLNKWKVFVPAANGSGALGEVLSTPLIGQPLIGHTQSFISIGAFDTQEEAENCLKYVKTKFARCLLGVLKATQHNPPEKWLYVPLQDFSAGSDIDWTLPVAEVDARLYKKYGLTQEEVSFIESKVKGM